jgi:hypothetical protein
MQFQKAISTILLLSFLTSTAAAQQVEELPKVETPQGEVDPGEAISPMRISQRAPFTGVMLSPKALASIIAKLKSIETRISLATEEAKEQSAEVCRHEKEVISIRNTADKDILTARIEDNNRNLQAYEKRIAEVKESQTDPALLIGLGALGGVAATVLTVFAVTQSLK